MSRSVTEIKIPRLEIVSSVIKNIVILPPIMKYVGRVKWSTLCISKFNLQYLASRGSSGARQNCYHVCCICGALGANWLLSSPATSRFDDLDSFAALELRKAEDSRSSDSRARFFFSPRQLKVHEGVLSIPPTASRGFGSRFVRSGVSLHRVAVVHPLM